LPPVPRRSAPDPRLARAVRRLRDRRDVSQETVAREADLTVSTYARIERGEIDPAFSTVAGIASALDVTLVELAEAIEGTR
jgi:transcriptional regulator with XRE-family HTH domain